MASTLQVAGLQVEISDNFKVTLVYRQNWEQARKRESQDSEREKERYQRIFREK